MQHRRASSTLVNAQISCRMRRFCLPHCLGGPKISSHKTTTSKHTSPLTPAGLLWRLRPYPTPGHRLPHKVVRVLQRPLACVCLRYSTPMPRSGHHSDSAGGGHLNGRKCGNQSWACPCGGQARRPLRYGDAPYSLWPATEMAISLNGATFRPSAMHLSRLHSIVLFFQSHVCACLGLLSILATWDSFMLAWPVSRISLFQPHPPNCSPTQLGGMKLAESAVRQSQTMHCFYLYFNISHTSRPTDALGI